MSTLYMLYCLCMSKNGKCYVGRVKNAILAVISDIVALFKTLNDA